MNARGTALDGQMARLVHSSRLLLVVFVLRGPTLLTSKREARHPALPPIQSIQKPPREKWGWKSGGGGVRPARYSARGRTSHSAIGAHDQVQSHHALGACESVSVGAKIGSSSVVDTHKIRSIFDEGIYSPGDYMHGLENVLASFVPCLRNVSILSFVCGMYSLRGSPAAFSQKVC